MYDLFNLLGDTVNERREPLKATIQGNWSRFVLKAQFSFSPPEFQAFCTLHDVNTMKRRLLYTHKHEFV